MGRQDEVVLGGQMVRPNVRVERDGMLFRRATARFRALLARWRRVLENRRDNSPNGAWKARRQKCPRRGRVLNLRRRLWSGSVFATTRGQNRCRAFVMRTDLVELFVQSRRAGHYQGTKKGTDQRERKYSTSWTANEPRTHLARHSCSK